MEPGRDPLSDLDVIEGELSRHGGLEDRPRLVALNKADVPDAHDLAEMVRPEIEARGLRCLVVSAAAHQGLRELSFEMARLVEASRAAAPKPDSARIVIRPEAVSGPAFEVRRQGEQWRVRGDKPERWVRQTDFSNDEAVGYLADRLARLGVEDRLLALGAQKGDDVVIGPEEDAVVFDFDPQVDAGEEILRGPRGRDPRLEGR